MSRADMLIGIVRELGACSDDELSVVHLLIEGLVRGRTQYGPLAVKDDQRSFTDEALAEFRDACVYLTAEMVKRRAK